jgi:hypothetical protein
VFAAVQTCLVCWAHFVVGVAWSTLDVGFAAVAVFGIALVAWEFRVRTPRAMRRHEALLQSYLHAGFTSTTSTGSTGSTARTVGAGNPVEVVDGQSTPHPTAPSSAFSSPPTTTGLSRAR